MSERSHYALKIWDRLSGLPGGKRLFSTTVATKAPYFLSINPLFEVLNPGHVEATMTKRWPVTNHLGTVHAIAMCNICELVGGITCEVSVPRSHRWIPKGMTVKYLAKAETDLRASCEIELPETYPDHGFELIAPVNVTDKHGTVVMSAEISMWISKKYRRIETLKGQANSLNNRS